MLLVTLGDNQNLSIKIFFYNKYNLELFSVENTSRVSVNMCCQKDLKQHYVTLLQAHFNDIKHTSKGGFQALPVFSLVTLGF